MTGCIKADKFYSLYKRVWVSLSRDLSVPNSNPLRTR
jgi:hypothetical protein